MLNDWFCASQESAERLGPAGDSLANQVKELLVTRGVQVVQSAAFLAADADTVAGLLQTDELAVAEETLWDAVVAWAW